MKKISLIFAVAFAASALFAEAPELRNMMPNSWQKLTRLSEQEENEFYRRIDKKAKYRPLSIEGGVYNISIDDLIPQNRRIYKEQCNSQTIYRLLGSDIPIEDAINVVVNDGKYTEEQTQAYLDRKPVYEIDFLQKNNDYIYITSIHYGYTCGYQSGFGYEYGNIMYRSKNSNEIGVFITNCTTMFYLSSKNEFDFEKCKGQIKGDSECTYTTLEDLICNKGDEMISIESSDYLVDPSCPLKYSIQNAFDGNPATSYVENTEDDLFRIKIHIQQYHPIFAVINGYASSNEIYKKNNRVKYFNYNYLLNDYDLNYQFIKGQGNAYFICKDIYRGEKYNDTCLAELNVKFEEPLWIFGEIDE